ncbi:hypothetical protein PROFUN_03552 [Planoprotostelium fungivorum]|uniref:Uncharacterized protein n=1 Tax=Planoprotostelium fungivorum TaxID=1890364 RepID=A0A2P6MSF1_9EUKA|nr:hypothetical protein PROFUN_03552 [Planoprotostelium fungivorum]
MLKGPSPRLDLSKKNLECIKDSDLAGFLTDDSKSKEKRLQSLFMQQNRLTTFPSQLIESTSFYNLRVLYINGNQIEEIPKEIGKMTLLVKLHLEDNLLKSIPKEIGDLRKLRKLYLNNNQLTGLPDTICALMNLRTLHLHNNHIRILTPFVAISTLKELTLFGNPIESPPPFAYNNKSLSFLLHYMRDKIYARQALVPSEQYIYTRSVNFKPATTAPTGKKNKGGIRSITRTSLNSRSIMSNIKRSRAMSTGNLSDRAEVVEDSLHINQNHLLYFLTNTGFYECQGHRDYMEDRCIVIPRLRQIPPKKMMDDVINLFSKVGYFGVFDGHGGVRCANYLAEVLHFNIFNSEYFARGRFEESIKEGFRKTDEDFLEQCRKHYLMDGSTCAIAMIVDCKLYTAHAGDSRVVLCRDKTAIRLTEDHKPDRDDELARVEKAGGEVIFRGNCFRVAGDLAMSRSFGDLRLKEPLKMVISEPEIRVEELTPKDKWVIIASDGLWDVVSDQKACDIVRRFDSPEEASKRLVDYALSMGTMDNTTAVVVKLNWHLDFLTEEELNCETSPPADKIVSPDTSDQFSPDELRRDSIEKNRNEDDSSEQVTTILERVRSSTVAFRDSLNKINTEGIPLAHEYKQQPNELRLQITIPRSSVIKLMHFDMDAMIGDVFKMLLDKERDSADPDDSQLDPNDFTLLTRNKETKEEIIMDREQKLSHYNLSNDMELTWQDPLELRYIGDGQTPRVSGSKAIYRVISTTETQNHVNSPVVETKFFEQAINCFIWEQNHWRLLGDDRAKVTLSMVGEKPTSIRLLAAAGEQVLLDMVFGLEATLQRDSETFYELRTPTKRVGFNFDKEEDAQLFNSQCLKEMVNISANSADLIHSNTRVVYIIDCAHYCLRPENHCRDKRGMPKLPCLTQAINAAELAAGILMPRPPTLLDVTSSSSLESETYACSAPLAPSSSCSNLTDKREQHSLMREGEHGQSHDPNELYFGEDGTLCCCCTASSSHDVCESFPFRFYGRRTTEKSETIEGEPASSLPIPEDNGNSTPSDTKEEQPDSTTSTSLEEKNETQDLIGGNVNYIILILISPDINTCSFLEELPRDIVHILARFLDRQDRRQVRLVCRSYRRIMDGLFPLVLHLRERDESTQQMESVQSAHTKLDMPNTLHGVHFRGRVDLKRFSCMFLSELSHIQFLDLSYHDGVVNSVLLSLPVELKFLNIRGCNRIDNEGLKSIHYLQHLEDLSIRACTKITDEGLTRLPPSLVRLDVESLSKITSVGFSYFPRNLKKLNASCCSLVDDDAIANLPRTMHQLDFSNCDKITDFGLSHLPDGLLSLNLAACKRITNKGMSFLPKTIQILDLGSCVQLTDNGLSHLPSNLRHLDMPSCSITDDLFRHLPRKMERLNLSWCKRLTGEGIRDLPSSVQHLDLSFCRKIVDDGLSSLPAGLTFLSLTYCPISGVGLKNLPHGLVHLSLNNCSNITDHALKNLPKNLKRLSILHCLLLSPMIIEVLKNQSGLLVDR